MNKWISIPFVIIVITIILSSCASQYPMLYKKAYIETLQIKDYCQKKSLSADAIAKADSLYSLAVRLNQNGKEKDAYVILEVAGVYYRIAVSQDEIAQSKKEIDKLGQLLVVAKDKLDTYKKVISELETMK